MTEIASHRGGALLWAENSRLAFEQTAKLPGRAGRIRRSALARRPAVVIMIRP